MLVEVAAGWIYDDNLRLFMEALAYFSSTTFDEDDWTGLEYDLLLRPDELDRERRVAWPIPKGRLDLFYEPGASTVEWKLTRNRVLAARAEALGYVLQHGKFEAD